MSIPADHLQKGQGDLQQSTLAMNHILPRVKGWGYTVVRPCFRVSCMLFEDPLGTWVGYFGMVLLPWELLNYQSRAGVNLKPGYSSLYRGLVEARTRFRDGWPPRGVFLLDLFPFLLRMLDAAHTPSHPERDPETIPTHTTFFWFPIPTDFEELPAHHHHD